MIAVPFALFPECLSNVGSFASVRDIRNVELFVSVRDVDNLGFFPVPRDPSNVELFVSEGIGVASVGRGSPASDTNTGEKSRAWKGTVPTGSCRSQVVVVELWRLSWSWANLWVACHGSRW